MFDRIKTSIGNYLLKKGDRKFLDHLHRHMRAYYQELKDKSAPVDGWYHHGNQDIARRHPKTRSDIEAAAVNPNVYIATRAISDAIAGLPVNVIGVETINGVQREYEDTDHPVNDILQNPNPTHSWSDIIRHIVKSYLLDGNSFLTKERITGPNKRIEIWPRDPRTVEMTLSGGVPSGYIVGNNTPIKRIYKLSEMIHIKDTDPDNPYYGSSRINSVRTEIQMDYAATRFNQKFFENGAALHLMFTPDINMSEDQHDQLMTNLTANTSGVDNAFKIFINRFAGKFTSPDMKHKDIAFIDLLKHNREKIFGVFGLSPFRGGVMEYANYANALAQDLDFWNNTIQPILTVIEAAINKQLIWPLFGNEFRLKFDLSNVPAVKGDPKVQAEIFCMYADRGIMTINEIREKLDLPPLAEQEVEKPSDDEKDDEPVDELPTEDEQKQSETAIHRTLRVQYRAVADKLETMTLGGKVMSMLVFPDEQARECFNVSRFNSDLVRLCEPIVKGVILERGTARHRELKKTEPFDLDNSNTRCSLRVLPVNISSFSNQILVNLKSLIGDTDSYGWTLQQLLGHVRKLFTSTQAKILSDVVLGDAVSSSKLLSIVEKHKEDVVIELRSERSR